MTAQDKKCLASFNPKCYPSRRAYMPEFGFPKAASTYCTANLSTLLKGWLMTP